MVHTQPRTAERPPDLVLPHTRRQPRTRLVWVAALAGTLHASFSLYWGLGGTWLLDTVGDWAVRLTTEEPVAAGLGLAALAATKLTAAWVPVLVEAGRLGHRTIWRRVSWIGGTGLIAYGGFNTVVALCVVSGLLTPDGGYDPQAMIGHAALWDPLFLLWGAALVGSLRRGDPTDGRRTERPRRRGTRPSSDSRVRHAGGESDVSGRLRS